MSKRERQIHMTLSAYERRALEYIRHQRGEVSIPGAIRTCITAVAVQLGFDDLAKNIFKESAE